MPYSDVFYVFVQTVDAYNIEPSEGMVYVTKGSTAFLPCVITGTFDTGRDAVNWEKYMLEVQYSIHKTLALASITAKVLS